jgi:hypothetical protein
MRTETVRQGERGTILIVSLIAGVLILGITYAFYWVSRGEIDGAREEARREKALQTAEAGIEEALDRLNRGEDPDVDRSSDSLLGYRVGEADVGVTTAGNRIYTLTSRGRHGGEARAVEVVVENRTLAVRTRAAVTSNGPVDLSGSITVDGRDYDASGATVLGAGVYGVTSSQLVTVGGDARVGGNGTEPIRRATPLDGVYQPLVAYGDGIDNDLDGRIDEERHDGYDDDGDGRVDEDLAPFPTSPDALFGVKEGTLRRVAQAQGTYFTSPDSFQAWLTANGGSIPGGKIVVLDFPATPDSGPVWNPADFGSTMNDPPSILVFHSPYSNAVMKNLHGRFKGLILADFVSHTNGDARIVGAIYSFGHDRIGNVYGNGDARVLYSSAVLSMLPTVPSYAPVGWREVTPEE